MVTKACPATRPITFKVRVLAAGCLALLGACGSGGDGSPPPDVPPAAVSGWVGERSAWPQARVSLSCANGGTAQATTGADGRYAATVPAAALPCLVQARAVDGTRLWSAAVGAGTANVTPLSNAIVARALRVAPALLFDSPALAQRLTPALLANAQAALDAATVDLDLGTSTPAIATPIDSAAGAADPQVRAQGRLLDQLTLRQLTATAFAYALARDTEPGVLRDAIAQGDTQRLLALPPALGPEVAMPQLVRGNVHTLAGNGAQALLLGRDFAFRSDDGGRHWAPLNLVMDQVITFRGALIGRSLGRLLRSTDGGGTWAAVASAPPATDTLGIGPDLRLWWVGFAHAQASDDGVHWVSAVADDAVSDALQRDVYRELPRRSVISGRQGTPHVVRACLGTSCAQVDLGDKLNLLRVHGSDEVLAGSQLDGRMSVSADGLTWQVLNPMPASPLAQLPFRGVLRTASGRLLALQEGGLLLASDDNGGTWQAVAPATSGQDWQALDSSSVLRRDTAGALELSTDGGQAWRKVPALPPGDLREARSPDGTMLRISLASSGQPGPLDISKDGGRSWTTALADRARSVAWLGDRFGAVVNGDLRVSRDGRQWASAGPVPAFSTESSLAGIAGVWVLGFREYPTLFPHTLWESTDEGRSWKRIFQASNPSENAAGQAFSCGGALFAQRIGVWVRRADGWKPVTLPDGTFAAGCSGGLLSAADDYSGTRSHHVSADQGTRWIPIGRPRTQPVFDGERWWSIGEASITLWPR